MRNKEGRMRRSSPAPKGGVSAPQSSMRKGKGRAQPSMSRLTAAEIVAGAIRALEEEFGIPEPLPAKPPLDELIFTILSQNTNDVNRDRAYASLRERFPTWEEVLEADEAEIAGAIAGGGLSRIKSARIKEILGWVKREVGQLSLDFLRDLPVEEARRLLSSLKGVGPKTIHCVLLFSCGQPAFPVDTHILRIARRLKLIPPNASSEQAHQILGELVPPEKRYSFHINLIRHGRKTCKAQKPQCPACPLYHTYCEGTLSPDEAG